MEMMLRELNFARFSGVQASLKQSLMQRHRNHRQMISDYELDMVAAAAMPIMSRNAEMK